MNPRGAIGLSINMIVMIVISLAILAGGIVLLNNLIGGAEDIKDQLDQQTQQRLNDLLVDQGKPVALPFHTATISRGEDHIFGIGILNTGGTGDKFTLEVEFEKALDLQGVQLQLTYDPLEWARFDRNELIILNGENQKKSILITVPKDALSGQYFFKARIMTPAGQHGNTQRFFVTVK